MRQISCCWRPWYSWRPWYCLRPMTRAFAGDLAAFLLMDTRPHCCWLLMLHGASPVAVLLLLLAVPAIAGVPTVDCWCPWCLSAWMYSDHQWVLQYCVSTKQLSIGIWALPHTSLQVLEEGSEVQCLKIFCPFFSPKSFYKSHYAGVSLVNFEN
jgi:hypothetical protein